MRLRQTLWSSWPLRALASATVGKLLLSLMGPGIRSLAVVNLLDLAANLVIAATLGYLLFVLLLRLQRRLLWRVRRKLILSYIFIGLIPVVLIVTLFLLAGTLTLLSVSSFMVKRSLDELVREASSAATAAAGELRVPGAAAGPVLMRHQRALESRGLVAGTALIDGGSGGRGLAVFAGSWAGGQRPDYLPAWVSGGTFEGLVAVRGTDGVHIAARAAQPVQLGDDSRIVVVDLPIGDSTAARIQQDTGAELRGATIVMFDSSATDQPIEVEPVVALVGNEAEALVSTEGLAWFAFLEYTDWETGEQQSLTLQIRVPPMAFYERVFGAQARIGDVSLGYAFLVVLAAVASLFLIIEFTALVMGFALAKSITGAVHELFVGTRHVRQGRF